MIWVRRIASIPLIFIFLILFLVTFLVLKPINAITDPSFIQKQLVEADVYTHILNDTPNAMLPAVFQFLEQKYPDKWRAIKALGISEVDIMDLVDVAITPEWLQLETEQAVDEITNYLNGDQDDFRTEIQLKGIVESVSDVMFKSIPKAQLYDYIVDELLANKIQDGLSTLPEGFHISDGEFDIEASIRRAVPESWVIDQVNNAETELTPYILGEKDSFSIRIAPSDIDDSVLAEMRIFIQTNLLGDVVFAFILDSYLLALSNELGISISSSEIQTVIRYAMTSETLEEIMLDFSNEYARYLLGKTDHFSLNIDMNTILVDEDSQEFLETMDHVRDVFKNGWVYTHADLLSDMDPNEQKIFLEARELIKTGFIYTEQDLRGEIDKRLGLGELENYRHTISLVKYFDNLSVVAIIILLSFIGAIAAREWRNKAKAIGVILLVASVLLFVITALLSSALEAGINSVVMSATQDMLQTSNSINDLYNTLLSQCVNLINNIVFVTRVSLVSIINWYAFICFVSALFILLLASIGPRFIGRKNEYI